MPQKSFMLRLTGAFLIGAMSLIISIVLVVLFSPFIIPFLETLFPFLVGSILFLVAVLIFAVLIYVFTYLGVVIYYFFKPMKVSTKSKGYSLGKSREAGRRKKGKSRKRK